MITRVSLGAVSVLLVLLGHGWAAVLPLAVLYGFLLVPHRPAIEVWPYGLVALLATAYLTYIVLWTVGAQGVSFATARSILLMMIAVGVWSPSIRRRNIGKTERHQSQILIPAVLVAAVALYILAFHNPAVLINAHLGGGDHSNHVGFSYSLVSHVHRAPMPSPFTLTGYQHAVHFFVALLSASSVHAFQGTILGLVFRDFAVFDILVMAGILQIAASSSVRIVSHRTATNLLSVVPAVVLYRFPDLLGHFWLSGFSTSLAGLLVLTALVGAQFTIRQRNDRVLVCLISMLVLFGVYQPLAVVPVVALLAESRQSRIGGLVSRAGAMTLVLVGPMTGIFLIGTLEGPGGPVSSTLMRDGVSIEPSLMMYGAVLAAMIVLGITVRRFLNPILTGLTVASVTNGFWFLSRRLGADGSPVYYVRKLIWTSIAVGILVTVVCIAALLQLWILSLTSKTGAFASIAVVLVTTFVVGTDPIPRFRFVSGEWFVSQLLDGKSPVTAASIALNPADMFTSHLANVALTALSPLAHEFDLALLDGRSPRDLCRVGHALGATEVFTDASQVANLGELGCGSSGQRIVSSGD